MKSGDGKLSYKNGDSYGGGWKHDMFNGKGVFTDHYGNIYNGNWKNDQLGHCSAEIQRLQLDWQGGGSHKDYLRIVGGRGDHDCFDLSCPFVYYSVCYKT